jgi:pimeloyl-ACP methyl ester carboxylesterase
MKYTGAGARNSFAWLAWFLGAMAGNHGISGRVLPHLCDGFLGFGESGKKRETYAVSDFVSLVNQFMEQLGIVHAPLVGHSMGGTVSLSVAIQYPERVSKVVVVGSPMVGSSLAPLLKWRGIARSHSCFST